MVLAPIVALASLLGSRGGRGSVCAVGVVVFFVVLTGGEPSVMRAGVMATIALVGTLIGRPRDDRLGPGVGRPGAPDVLDPWLVW